MSGSYAWFIQEYFARVRMKKLGYTSDFSKLPDLHCAIFTLIDDNWEDHKNKEREKANKKAKAKSRMRRGR